jgi:hypothetical protein
MHNRGSFLFARRPGDAYFIDFSKSARTPKATKVHVVFVWSMPIIIRDAPSLWWPSSRTWTLVVVDETNP